MSLDVYLRIPGSKQPSVGSGIFVRENGRTIEISQEEWDRRHPGRVPCKFIGAGETDVIYSSNITHNLGKMAAIAGIYEALWRPEEIGITKAEQLIGPLSTGLALLLADPDKYKAYNPENGWGDYDGLVEFVKNYLAACVDNPQADVEVSR